MKDYYSLYVKNCLKQMLMEDYGDKKKLRVHNASFNRLRKLQEEMKEVGCLDVFAQLLKHEDHRVVVNAATFCIKNNVYKEEAIQALYAVMQNPQDRLIAFSAGMVLRDSNK